VLAFGSGIEKERIPLAAILACLFGTLWLMHAANIRAFCAGDRMTDPFATKAQGMRGIGVLGKDVTMRWIPAAISMVFMALEAWFVYMAGSSWISSGNWWLAVARGSIDFKRR
jgi:hypothetical protein